jgi:diaminopimelate epimerase
VRFTSDLDTLDVDREGRAIRHSSRFDRDGVNVNFVQRLEDGGLFVRTFERGVEAETMSCGTGVTASALASAEDAEGRQEIPIKTLGGRLRVDFEAIPGRGFRNIWLVGPATFVFTGEVDTQDIKAEDKTTER